MDVAEVKEPQLLLRIYSVFQAYEKDLTRVAQGNETTLTAADIDLIAAVENLRDIIWGIDD